MNSKGIIFYLGLLCFPISFLAFINILYSLYFDHFINVNSYTLTLLISLLIGFLFYFFGRKSQKRLNFFDQVVLLIVSYFVTSLLISIVYFTSNYNISFINAVFESFSGITLTGFSIFNNIKYLDPTLIIWRSSSQWIGGLYFLIFLIMLFNNKQFYYKLNALTYSFDSSLNSANQIKNDLIKITIFYLSLSLLIFFLLSLSDVRLFNGLNLSMSLISSGGFLPTNSLDTIIKTPNQKFFYLISLIISFINIFFIFNLFKKGAIIRKHQEDLFLIIFFLIISIILILFLKDKKLLDILISVASCLSNSGISITKMPDNFNLYFLFITIIGGSLISNTSGIKLIRIYILLKSTTAEILKLVRPNNIISQNILFSEKKISKENAKISFLIFISFFLSIFALSSILIFDQINFEDSFKISVLTLTNTVNSDIFGMQNINFSNLLVSSKIGLIIFMVIGKIELISLFLLIKKFLFKN